MNDAVKGRVEDVCKSQLWHASKFVCDDDQINDACEIAMSNIDDFKTKIFKPDGSLADATVRAATIVDFAKMHGGFIVSTINEFTARPKVRSMQQCRNGF
jgi:hypothetical protein